MKDKVIVFKIGMIQLNIGWYPIKYFPKKKKQTL